MATQNKKINGPFGLTVKEVETAKRKPLLNENGEEVVHLMDKLNKESPNIHNTMEVRSMLAHIPEDMKDVLGEAYVVCEHLINYANALPATKEIMRRNYFRMRQGMQVDQTVGLARLLLEQVLTAWLRLKITDHEYAIICSEANTYKEYSYWEQRLTNAHNRFNRAVATFADAKVKLGQSLFVQINYAADGGQQVNIAGQPKASE